MLVSHHQALTIQLPQKIDNECNIIQAVYPMTAIKLCAAFDEIINVYNDL
jgi:hypothetical protein